MADDKHAAVEKSAHSKQRDASRYMTDGEQCEQEGGAVETPHGTNVGRKGEHRGRTVSEAFGFCGQMDSYQVEFPVPIRVLPILDRVIDLLHQGAEELVLNES